MLYTSMLIFFVGLNSIFALEALITLESLNLPPKVKSNLKNQVYSASEVKTEGIKQTLKLDVAGLHTKSCMIALSKISQYERYQEFIGFIARSSYDDKSKMIKMKVSHLLMPFDMHLLFQIERMTTTGHYPFTFKQGFLRGLKGVIKVGSHQKKCLFHLSANWRGPVSRIPDRVFAFFLEVLGEKLMTNLFRISRTL